MGKGEIFGRMMVYILNARMDRKNDAALELTAYLKSRGDKPDKSVPKLGWLLLGALDERSLIAKLHPDDPYAKSGTCQIWFYAGMNKLFSGDKESAAECFQRCLKTDSIKLFEYDLAKAELEFLQKEE